MPEDPSQPEEPLPVDAAPPAGGLREVVGAVRELVRVLLRQAASDPEALAALRSLAVWLQEEVGTAEAEEAASPAPQEEVAPQAFETRTLRIGGEVVEVPVRAGSGEEAAPPAAIRTGPERSTVELPPMPPPRPSREWTRELARASRSAALKVRACDAAARGEVEALRDRLLDAARAEPRCWLWPFDPSHPLPGRAVLDLCARAYANLVTALDVVQLVPRWASGEEAPDEDVLVLLAEAQSAVRGALFPADIEDDHDQMTAFLWLREQTEQHRIFVERFMRRDDVADPAHWDDLAERLAGLEERVSRSEEARKTRKRLVGKVAYQVKKLGDEVTPEGKARAWEPILRTLDAWVEASLPPSSREVCEPLADVIDELPEGVEVPEGAGDVLEAVDRWIASRQEGSTDAAPRPEAPSPEVQAARDLLRDRIVILIGGECRDRERARLERDLGLAELRWLATRPHRSLDPLVEQIQRPEVDLVMVASRWSDHAFADLKPAAEKAGKIFLKLPSGYGTNQVAHQVMEQASERLRKG